MKAGAHSFLNLKLPEGQAFYAKRNFTHVGPPPELSFPQPWNSLIARLRYGTWCLFRIQSSHGPLEAQYRASEGHRYVLVELEENETVCFHHRSLVGYSGGVRLHTELSLQLSAICLGRTFFHMATGPGFLVLDSHGEPQIIEDLQVNSSFPPSRLLCWSKETEFSLVGSVKELQVVLDSPLFFQLEKNRLVVIDAVHDSQRPASSLFRILKNIYLPRL